MDHSKIPVLSHSDGICHCYVDKDADINMAVDVVNDSKRSMSLFVMRQKRTLSLGYRGKFLPKLKKKTDQKCYIKGCEKTRKIIDVRAVSVDDWKTEHLDYILSVKVVDSLDEAINHINTFGSGHTDTIITSDQSAAERFMDWLIRQMYSGIVQPDSAMGSGMGSVRSRYQH